ncbi:MAG: hypothetical protein JWM30_3310 [Burkholderia sp.]|jgi:hypothetical protein|nr:hypothetical protein [Burkholderia sp.]
MYRAVIILPLLLLGLNCQAACEVASDGNDTISLVVQSGGCFRSDQQRQAFATQLKQAVQAMDGGGNARSPHRKSTAEQLNGFGDLKRQSKHLSPPPTVYYGQR